MASKIKLLLAATLVAVIAAFLAPTANALACVGETGGGSFFAIPSWHEYLDCPDGETIELDVANVNDLWRIAVAVLEAILRISGIVALGYVIFGGFKYITSQGSPDSTASARKTIIYALVGMVVSIFASVMVSFAMGLVTGGNTGTGGNDLGIPTATTDGSLQRVLNFIYALGGILAALYIVIAGIKFATSAGDPQKAANARNTIIYALIGLVIVISAYLITGAVIDRI